MITIIKKMLMLEEKLLVLTEEVELIWNIYFTYGFVK